MQNEICFQRIQLTFNMLTQEFAMLISMGVLKREGRMRNLILLRFVWLVMRCARQSIIY